MIKPYYETELGALYHGDCLEILPQIEEKVDLVLTDPPYGMDWDTDYTRFTGGASDVRTKHEKIKGDDSPFDPTPFLNYKNVILFGSNHYANQLPKGTWLVWSKKPMSKLGTFLSDCELAWKKGGEGVYLFHQEWDGFNRQGERNTQRKHPTQKPIALMEWCIGLSKTTGVIKNPNKQGVRIRRESKGRGGKMVSVVDGLSLQDKELKTVLKKLKGKLGTGGAVKDGMLEIQGDHREKLVLLLEKEGIKAKLAGG